MGPESGDPPPGDSFAGPHQNAVPPAGPMSRSPAPIAASPPAYSGAGDTLIAHLVERSRRGDQAAARQLALMFHGPMLAEARGYVRQLADAEEVLQNAFAKAFSKLDSLEEPRAFGGWLKQIVTRLALNHRRGAQLRKSDVLEESSVDQHAWAGQQALRSDDSVPRDPASITSQRELLLRVRSAMEQLSPVQRRVLEAAIDKVPQKELAEELKTTVQMIKYHTFEARKKLKKLVPEAAED
jgi:RNA polymerase sigma-70 factor, ECF subfamily